MELHNFTFADLATNGSNFCQFLALRKTVLVDGLSWTLPNDSVLEMDQYDHPLTHYSVVTQNGQVVAGARALSCSTKWNGWTYMLLDAHRSLLGGISPNLLHTYPQDIKTWECTRLVVDHNLSLSDRTSALRLVVGGLCHQAFGRGAHSLLSLSPRVLGRKLRQLGYDAEAIGNQYQCSEDGRIYRVFKMTCDPTVFPMGSNSSIIAA